MEKVELLKSLKKGDYFRFKGGKTVYVYNGKDRKYGYEYYKFDDVNDWKYTKNGEREVESKTLEF